MKQSLSPHHPAFPPDKHLVTEELHKLVCQASFQSRLALLANGCNLEDVPKTGTKGEQAEGWYQQAPLCQDQGQASSSDDSGEKQFVDLHIKAGAERGERGVTGTTSGLAQFADFRSKEAAD